MGAAFVPPNNTSGGGGGTIIPPSAISITRLGAAPSVNVSTHGTLDWFIANTNTAQFRSLTTNRFGKFGVGGLLNSFNGANGGQATSTTLMAGTTRSANATDAIELAAVSQTGSWGISTPNATLAFGVGLTAPSGAGLTRKLRLYWLNTLNTVRLRCALDDGTVAQVDLTDAATGTSHEHEITYTGGTILAVTLLPIARSAGTQQLAFAAASLGLG